MVNLDRDGASKASGKPVPATCALGAAHAGFACADLELTATTVKMASPTASRDAPGCLFSYAPRKMITPKISDHACANMPGLRLFRQTATNQNRTPNSMILPTAPTPS